MERQPTADIYLGEPKPRIPYVAMMLTLLCPGLGAVYLGQLLKGIWICLLYLAALGGFVVLWATLKFFPVLPLVVFALGIGLITVLLSLDAARDAHRRGSGYVLRGVNHPVIYALVALCFFYLPAAALVQYTGTRLWTLVSVETDAMFPTLVEGDLLLVDRTAYRDAAVSAGDVVVLRHEGRHDELRLGRIIGIPGDEVVVTDSVPVLNGMALARSLVRMGESQDEVGVAALHDVTPPVGIVTFAERNGSVSYLTSERPAEFGVGVEPFRLGDDEYYVLHDNRTHFGDSRDFGPVGRGDIVGQPLYVAYSSSSEDGVRWSRLAKRVQPPPLSD